jgi:predicted RNase H-like HicB family nuclease
MTLLPVTDDGSVPGYDCHVILSPPNEQGQILARAASLPGVTAQGSTERDVLRNIVTVFKAKLIECRDAELAIPWAEQAELPGLGEFERWIPVHL